MNSAVSAMKYRIARIEATPAERSSNAESMPSPSIQAWSRPLNRFPALPMNTRRAQNTAPKMNATVRLDVRSEATIATARSAPPRNQ